MGDEWVLLVAALVQAIVGLFDVLMSSESSKYQRATYNFAAACAFILAAIYFKM